MSAIPGTPTRTLLIANPSADVYGSDLQMLQTVAAMHDRGWQAVVVLPAAGPLVPMLREHGALIRFTDFPVLRRADATGRRIATLAARAAQAIPRLRQVIHDVAPDVVYVNTVTIPWWFAAARIARVPVMCHVHEAEAGDRKPVRMALNSPLLAADSLIAISTPTVEATTHDLPALRTRTRLIYNGVPAPDRVLTAAGPAEPMRAAVIGRLSPRKAPHIALEAIAILRREGRDIRLEVCGTPFHGYEWYDEQLRERATRPDLAGAVRFSGYVSPVWPALERAHLVLAPSLREPFGNAVVEAQLAGRPVVAAAAMGHLETVSHEETGLLVPPGDPVETAAAVRRLMDDRHLADALATRARARAVERFSVQRYRDDVFELIASLPRHPGRVAATEEVPA